LAASLRKMNAVMVSCLQVTWPVPQRFGYFQRSLAAYCRQSHANRELVIVLDQGDAGTHTAIASYVSSLGRDDIRIVEPRGKRSLGALRNISCENARGDVLCQWDDDDFHHPQRVEQELKALVESGSASVHLEEVMQFFPDSRTLYCTNWCATESRGLPGTLMCMQYVPIRYPETGSESQLGEDSAVSLQLQRHGSFHVLTGVPHLYVYVSHGGNLCTDEHHRMLVRELSLSKGLLRRREAQLREGLRPFDFGPGDVTVQGYNGPAFTLDAGAAISREAPSGLPSRRTVI